MKRFTIALLCAVLSSHAHSASAANASVATISGMQGKVLVNTGHGFVPATDALALKSGDKVMVGKGSFAKITYQSCTLPLSQSSVFVVTVAAPCEIPAGTGQTASGATGGVPGAGLPAAGGLPPIVTTLAFVGPAAVACAVKCDDWFGDDPVSGN